MGEGSWGNRGGSEIELRWSSDRSSRESSVSGDSRVPSIVHA